MQYDLACWHPGVHRFYGETLHYFFIKPSRNNRDWLRRLLSAIPAGASSYMLLGAYDAVLRVWLTQSQLDAADETLAELAEGGARIQPFVTTQARYLWASHDAFCGSDIDARSVARYAPTMLCRAQSGEAQPEEVEMLKRSGLLAPRSEAIDAVNGIATAVKFFMIIRCDRNRMGEVAAELEQQLKSELQRPQPILHMPSLYHGMGIGELLVKAHATDIGRITEFALHVSELGAEANVDTETLVVGRVIGESDRIGAVEQADAAQAIADRRVCAFFGIDRQLFSAQPEPRRTGMRNAFSQLEPLLQDDRLYSPVEKRVGIFFRAIVDQDQDLLFQALGVFGGLEYSWRERFLPWIAQLTGDKNPWPTVDEAIKATALNLDIHAFQPNTGGNGPRPTLNDYCDILGWIDKHRDGVVTARLGSNWNRSFKAGVEVRNSLAHGRPDLRDLEAWQHCVGLMAEALPLFTAVGQEVDQ